MTASRNQKCENGRFVLTKIERFEKQSDESKRQRTWKLSSVTNGERHEDKSRWQRLTASFCVLQRRQNENRVKLLQYDVYAIKLISKYLVYETTTRY